MQAEKFTKKQEDSEKMALINCPECTKEISDKATACPNCGLPLTQQYKSASIVQKEEVVMSGVCNRVKGFFVENGKAMLTNRRFIYLKHSIGKMLAIGAFVNLTAGSFDFDIPLSSIEKISDGRHGLSKILIITTKNSDEYKFYFTTLEDWKIAFSNLI
jgi:RNA polymerase subunit RPABC4/transcription elongation factor Spt4